MTRGEHFVCRNNVLDDPAVLCCITTTWWDFGNKFITRQVLPGFEEMEDDLSYFVNLMPT